MRDSWPLEALLSRRTRRTKRKDRGRRVGRKKAERGVKREDVLHSRTFKSSQVVLALIHDLFHVQVGHSATHTHTHTLSHTYVEEAGRHFRWC